MFKNAITFAFTKAFNLTAQELQDKLAQHVFTPLGSLEQTRTGFIGVMVDNGALAIDVGGNILVNVRKQDKILPAPYVKELLDERVEELEITQPFSATKKQRDELKEDVIDSLLPVAFKRTINTKAYINAVDNFIVIDASSRGKAEEVLAVLRKALDSLPVTSVVPNIDVNDTMTDWLKFDSEEGEHLSELFAFGTEAHFSTLNEDAATAVVKNQGLHDSDVSSHIASGKYVTKIELTSGNDSFLLKDDLSISRLKFTYAESESGNEEEDLLCDLTVMTSELNFIIKNIHSEFNIKATDSLEG